MRRAFVRLQQTGSSGTFVLTAVVIPEALAAFQRLCNLFLRRVRVFKPTLNLVTNI